VSTPPILTIACGSAKAIEVYNMLIQFAASRFEYVRKHEQWDGLPADNWIVVRIDGRGFSK